MYGSPWYGKGPGVTLDLLVRVKRVSAGHAAEKVPFSAN